MFDMDGMIEPPSRREMLKLLAAAGSMFALPGLALAAPKADAGFFSAKEMRFLQRFSDTIIPVTDTPGALAAGVPNGFDDLMVQWANEQTRLSMRRTLQLMSATLDEILGGASFEAASGERRLTALQQLDGLAFGDQPATVGAYRQFKSLLVRLYYASEIGATVELRHDPAPGEWRACIPFAEVGRTWVL